MLTEEGREVARECLSRSGMIAPNKSLHGLEGCSNFGQSGKQGVDIQEDMPDLECVMGNPVEKAAPKNLKKPKISKDVPPDYLEKVSNFLSVSSPPSSCSYYRSHVHFVLLLLELGHLYSSVM